jgi:hypothetical protein
MDWAIFIAPGLWWQARYRATDGDRIIASGTKAPI